MTLVDQIALGVYIGVLTGIFTALLVFLLSFVFQYLAGVAFPGPIGLMIGLGAAGLQGGLFGLMRNPALLQSGVIVTALIIVLLITLYAQKKGQDLGKAVPPKEVLLRRIRTRTLSPEVIRGMGRFGQVRVRVAGEVADMEGYPPLPDDLRATIREGEWTFPADLPMPELEKRLSEKLKTDHDLDDVAVAIDPEGFATVAAAPPSSGLSRRVPDGRQAVSLQAIVPTGLAAGDEVTVDLGEETVSGTVIGVKPGDAGADPAEDDADTAVADGGEEVVPPVPARATVAAGGADRVALAVDPDDVSTVVANDAARFVVEPRGRNREYELVSLLRRGDNGFRKLVLRPEGEYVDRRLGELDLRGTHDVAVLAVKRAEGWVFAPDGATTLHADDELFVTGSREGLDRVQEAMAP